MTRYDLPGGNAHPARLVVLTRSDQVGWGLTMTGLSVLAATIVTTRVPLGACASALSPVARPAESLAVKRKN
jgi:hypothetical protein